MTFRRLIISSAVVTTILLSLYVLVASQLLQEPDAESAAPPSANSALPVTSPGADSPAADATGANLQDEAVPTRAGAKSANRLIEIFGRIHDRDGRGIENVLISEERYFFAARSDARGYYQLRLDLPRHRFPTLQFLRNGYARQRISIGRAQLQQPLYELDVELGDQPDSVALSGWVGNEIGVSLEGARVELTALESGTGDNYSLTVFTDERGQFLLEGITADRDYRLSVNMAPDYPIYEDAEFRVGRDPEQVNIVLQSLSFVDIDGMILNRESAPIPDFELYAANLTTGIHMRKIVSDSSGFFSLKNFPLGEISLTTRGTEFHKITGLTLTDTEYRNLALTIDRGDYYLAGWITDSYGAAIERAMVTLERDFDDGPLHYHHYRSQASDGAGRFSFENLGAGEYRLTIYAQGYRKHELMHRLADRYDEIRVRLNPGKS